MSLELQLSSRHWSCDHVERLDPTTGQSVLVRPHLPMTPAEQSAVKELLDEAAGEPIEQCSGPVHLGDGGDFQVECGGRQSGYIETFTLRVNRELTPNLLGFVISLLDAGNLILVSKRDGAAISLKEANFDDAPVEMQPRIICHSADELRDVLQNGVPADHRSPAGSLET
ncbi:MAG: hypothetical protein ACIALR_09810 [Blastopirellula sp. JB062]